MLRYPRDPEEQSEEEKHLWLPCRCELQKDFRSSRGSVFCLLAFTSYLICRVHSIIIKSTTSVVLGQDVRGHGGRKTMERIPVLSFIERRTYCTRLFTDTLRQRFRRQPHLSACQRRERRPQEKHPYVRTETRFPATIVFRMFEGCR